MQYLVWLFCCATEVLRHLTWQYPKQLHLWNSDNKCQYQIICIFEIIAQLMKQGMTFPPSSAEYGDDALVLLSLVWSIYCATAVSKIYPWQTHKLSNNQWNILKACCELTLLHMSVLFWVTFVIWVILEVYFIDFTCSCIHLKYHNLFVLFYNTM